MATIIQTPDSLSLLRNLKSFVIGSPSEITFRLMCGTETVIEESYHPDSEQRVEIDVQDVVCRFLTTALPSADIFVQGGAVNTFKVYINGSLAGTFTVLASGVRKLSVTPSDFLKTNWLTWQPQTKPAIWDAPEYLSYYFVQAAVVKARFYRKDGTTKTVTLDSRAAGSMVTYNTRLSRLFGLSGEDVSGLYGMVDVWVETSSGTRLSYIQRYIWQQTNGDEHHYLCVNSLGGIDTFTFRGMLSLGSDISHEAAESGPTKVDITSDIDREWEQVTGYVGMREMKWIFELIASPLSWAVLDGAAEKIIVNRDSLRVDDRNNLHSCAFSFILAEGGRLMNLSRSEGDLATMEIPSPTGELFFLKARAADLPDADLEDHLLFLIQSPYSESWSKASLGAIREWVLGILQTSSIGLAAHSHGNQAVLDRFSDESGKPAYNGQPLATESALLEQSMKGHTHANLASLDAISVDEDNYINLTRKPEGGDDPVTERARAGYADMAMANSAGAVLDWFIPESLELDGETRHRLRLNPKYEGMYADGWVSAGGLSTATGGQGSAGGGGSLVSGLGDLADVTVGSSLSSGQALVWDGTRWTNGTVTPDLSGYAAKTALTDGSVTRLGTATVGDGSTPIYWNKGVPAAVRAIDGGLVTGYISAANRSYLVTHPEATGGVIIPFLYNDLAFLTARGGHARAYSTTDTDLTSGSLAVKTPFGEDASLDSMFNTSPIYKNFGNSTAAEMAADGIIIDIEMADDMSRFTYTNRFYIDFGAPTFRFANIDLLYRKLGEDGYRIAVQGGEVVSSAFFCTFSGSSDGITGLRIHLYNLPNTTAGLRIAQIGLINYDTAGLRVGYMSRGTDDRVFRGISPYHTATYDLGAAAYRWRTLYGTDLDITGGIRLGVSSKASASVMSWDEENNAWHLAGNLYADGFISSGGVSGTSGGGSIIASLDDISDVSIGGSLSAGQALVWDGSGWTNGTVAQDLSSYARKADLGAYLPLAGGVMAGAVTLPTGSNARTGAALVFGGDTRIGANTGGDLGLYAGRSIFLRPGGSATDGLVLSTDGATFNGSPLLTADAGDGRYLYQYAYFNNSTARTDGILIKTDLSTSALSMVSFHIVGRATSKSYAPFDTRISFYNFNGSSYTSMYSTAAIHLGRPLGDMYVFGYDGYIHLWLNPGVSQFTVGAYCWREYGASASNHVVSISIGAIPDDELLTRKTLIDDLTAKHAASATINGSALYADSLRDPEYHTFPSRRASANVRFADGGLHHFMATSTMNEGKPPTDAHIIHSSWDNANWEAQIAIPNYTSTPIRWRTQSNKSDWDGSEWVSLLDSGNSELGAQMNRIEAVNFNGSDLAISSKKVSFSAVTPGSVMMPNNNFASGISVYRSDFDNFFWAIDKRASVTLTGAGDPANLFDNFYETFSGVAAGETATILIESTNGEAFATYTYGTLCVCFYVQSDRGVPQSVSVRAYGIKSGKTGWYDYTDTGNLRNYAGTVIASVFTFQNTAIYNISKWEITVTAHATLLTCINQITHTFIRPRSQDTAVVTKYPASQSLHGPVAIHNTLAVDEASTLSGGIKLGTSTKAAAAGMTWDEKNNAWHLAGNLYADGFISSGGISGAAAGGPLVAALGDLTDVTVSDPSSGQVLRWDGSWRNAGISLGEMADVDMTGLEGGQLLAYDGTDSKWKPYTPTRGRRIFYGVCGSGTTSGTKEVECPEFTSGDLEAGTVLIVYMSYWSDRHVSSKPTYLDVNSTGAHMVSTGTAYVSWAGAECVMFVYSAQGAWRMSPTYLYMVNHVSAGSSGQGSSVTVTPALASGTKIADITVDGAVTSLYAPSSSSGAASPATADSYGTVKVAYANTRTYTVNSLTETAGRFYGVEMNGDGRLFVNVPWTDTVGGSGGDVDLSGYLALSGGTMTGTLATQQVRPKANNTYNLGDASLYWNSAYMKRIYLAAGVYLEYDSADKCVRVHGAGVATDSFVSAGGVSNT